MSERAQKILAFLTPSTQFIRQQSLAEQFNCSRRTIGRALKELKDAGLLVDLNKRHQNRCKIYSVIPGLTRDPWIPGQAWNDKTVTPQAEQQLKLYRFTFETNFRHWPDWEKHYPQVTRELAGVDDMNALFRQTFDKLYAIQSH